jgi:mono/diheme cytochrome c family protein
MDRSISVHDISRVINEDVMDVPLVSTYQTVATELLTPQELIGKQFFYDAFDVRMSLEAYMSCASCHNDGAHDGRTWDFTQFGEGLRNTIALEGHGVGHGLIHWTANFDEIQDFEGQIRAFAGGTGLMTDVDFNTGTRADPLGDPKAGISPDLDALAAYAASLTTVGTSPTRDLDGTLSATAETGEQIYLQAGCTSCHSGGEYTDSEPNGVHDIGTIKPSSGPISAIDTPTLRGLWAGAPYLHDGTAQTIRDAIIAHNGINLSDPDLDLIVAYVLEIDDAEPAQVFVDDDSDGIPNTMDNCSLIANGPTDVVSAGPSQHDTDSDLFGNRCDADFNNDGFVNFGDLATFKAMFGTADPNVDLDGDGIVNFADLAIFKSLFGSPPGPSGKAGP